MTRYLFLLLALLMAPAASAQSVPFDIRSLDAYFDKQPKVEVNLRGSLLRLAVEATADSEPEVAEMVRGLNAVTVRVYPLESARAGLSDQLSAIGSQFESDGWFTFVRVRGDEDDPEDVSIYVRDDGDMFGGMVVMALDPEDQEAAFIIIDGLIDPAQVGRLSARFGGPDTDDAEDDDDDDNE